MSAIVKVLSLPIVREGLGTVLSKVFRGGKTQAKVSAPGSLAMIVGAAVAVIAALDPGLGAILAEYDVNGLVIGLVGLIGAVVGYFAESDDQS